MDINYRLQFIYYNTTYNILTYIQYNVLNNNTKFKDQLEVKFVTTSIGLPSLLYILELSRPTRVEMAVKNTTVIVTYKVLLYIQMSQQTTCFGLF